MAVSRTRNPRDGNAMFRPAIGTDNGGIQSVDRALLILDILAEQGGEATLSNIAECAGLNVSTCHHLITTLARWGYVARVPGKRTYFLGPRILHLSYACLRQVDLPRLAQHHIDDLNEATGEAVQLAIIQGTDLVGLLRREARHAVRIDFGLGGKHNAAHATASGKAILAWLPEVERDRILADKGLTPFTEKTITSKKELIEQLRSVRRTGIAVDRQEFQAGVVCIGAAIRDHTGSVAGAISVSIPIFRVKTDHLTLVQTEVLRATRDLSLELGAPGALLETIDKPTFAKPTIKGGNDAATAKRKNIA